MLENNGSEQLTRHWLDNVVVGLNLCPFAAPHLKSNTIALKVCDSLKTEEILSAILVQLDELQSTDEKEIATSLLIFSRSLKSFSEYWNVAGIANELLEEAGLEGIIQIATFHPDYCFDGNKDTDIENYTNRSPFPMLHFIREANISRVLENYPNPEQIPENNIKRLRQLGITELSKLLNKSN